MKVCTKNFLMVMSAFVLFADIAMAQVGPDGNLAYTLSNNQESNPAANNLDKYVIRNRLDSGCTWTASADALLYDPHAAENPGLILATTPGTELLNSNGFNFNWAAGPRVGIVGEDVIHGCDVEASYFGIDGWSASNTFVSPDEGADLFIFSQPQFTILPGGVINFNYISRLHSSEINLRHPVGNDSAF